MAELSDEEVQAEYDNEADASFDAFIQDLIQRGEA